MSTSIGDKGTVDRLYFARLDRGRDGPVGARVGFRVLGQTRKSPPRKAPPVLKSRSCKP